MNKCPNVILIFCNLPQRLPKTLVEVLEVCRILILTVMGHCIKGHLKGAESKRLFDTTPSLQQL